MAETAALLADEVLPALPLRQWVISFPFAHIAIEAAGPGVLLIGHSPELEGRQTGRVGFAQYGEFSFLCTISGFFGHLPLD